MPDANDRPGREAKQARNGRREPRPAFQFYPGDFTSSPKVRRMTLEERGAYITLLSDAWTDDGIEPDLQAIADRLGVERQDAERLMAGTLGRCFELIDGRLRNPRQERERELLDARSQRLAEAGARGGRARAKPTQAEAPPEPGEAGLKPGLASAKPSGMGWDGMGWDGTQEGEPEREAPPQPVVARVAAKDLEGVPEGILTDLDRWAVARRQIGKPLGASTVRSLLAIARKDPAAFRRRVDLSISNGTTVFLEDRPDTRPVARLTAREASDVRHSEAWDEFMDHLNQAPTEPCLTPPRPALPSAGSATSPTPPPAPRTPTPGANGSPGSTTR